MALPAIVVAAGWPPPRPACDFPIGMTCALSRASDLGLGYDETNNQPAGSAIWLHATTDIEDLGCLERPEEFLYRSKVESVGELEQGGQLRVGIPVQEFVNRFPRHPDPVSETADAGDALLPHALIEDSRDSSDGGPTRAVARERPRSLIARIASSQHDSVSLASYNAVIQCARPRAEGQPMNATNTIVQSTGSGQ
jgi:hypothetical protein